MKDSFHQIFLQGSGITLPPPPGPGFQLALFGKHPAWDDHMEDIGMRTASLRIFKKLVYVGGIGTQIDQGNWEKLAPSARLDSLDHFFLWKGHKGFLLAKSWRSSDGKRRKVYPMIACVHFFESRLFSDLETSFAALDALETACKAATTREEVAAAHAAATEALSEAEAREESGESLDPEEWLPFLNSPEMDPDREGFFRSLHFMRGNLEPYRPSAPKNRNWSPAPQQMRLPLCAKTGSLSFLLWTIFLRSQIDPVVPLLLFRHRDCDWIDATIGEPGPAEFFRLRAGLEEVPLTNRIPYRIPDDLRERFETVLNDFEHPGGGEATIWEDGKPSSSGVFKGMKRWLHADSS